MMRCDQCDDLLRENAGMADEIAFWAFQAKWYYAAAHGIGRYDDLPPARQKAIDAALEQNRINENRERLGHVPPAHEIGS